MIWDKAEELGRLIGQLPEYKALRRAETGLRDDQDAQSKVELIQKLARQMDELVAAVVAAAHFGDHVLVMSNGGFGGVHEKLLAALAA